MNVQQTNLPLLCAFRGLQMSLFPVAIITLFWKRHIGMSMEEILLLQGCFGLAMAACEFPSGYLADRIGYRRSLVAASLLMTCGWSVYCVADSFAAVLCAELILGLSMSLISGSDSALLYESLRALDREGEFSRWNGRVRFWGQAAEGTAALAAGVVFLWWQRLPFVLEIGVWLAAAVVAWRLVEPERHLPPSRGHLRQVGAMFRELLVDNPALRAVACVTIVLGLASFIPVWLVPLYATGAGLSDAWIGPIWAVANYTVAAGALMSDGIARWLGLLPALLVCVVLVAAGYAGLGLTHAAYGVAFYFCLTFMRGVFGPALLHQEQRLIPSSDRAGFLSLRGFLFRIGFLALAPIIGRAIDARGQRPVLLVVGAALVVAGVGAWSFLWRATRSGPGVDAA
jgi:predicted MFS family arabinose efflux permease